MYAFYGGSAALASRLLGKTAEANTEGFNGFQFAS
jgi:hypothetical protein